MKVSIAVETTMTLVCLPDDVACVPDSGATGDGNSSEADEDDDMAGVLIECADLTDLEG
jgi:hypothetical protein